ncbi:hypothetical protein GS597_14070 [Synechococcales cyanobacterium C]|uniref:Ycf66 family protein n=1 Tax=Petrachloros mirabilis ULC683 TaxID=2781853 RepID=A0A8K2A8W2_9CYAN|nr:Ycf66 family protein [Petrachloros mirabilis]NCJ07614.1 hypothetical protein [Petrachloros mirabilis ULC683]
MLTYLLVWIVGLGSLGIYLAAFIFPEVRRNNDLLWSGIGLFYALMLWIYAGRVTGGLLLGEAAGVALLVWLGWQTMTQRRALMPPDQQTPVPPYLQKAASLAQQALDKVTQTAESSLSGSGQKSEENSAANLLAGLTPLKEKVQSLFKGKSQAETEVPPPLQPEVDDIWEEDTDTSAPETAVPVSAPPEPPVAATDMAQEDTVVEINEVPEPVAEATPLQSSSEPAAPVIVEEAPPPAETPAIDLVEEATPPENLSVEVEAPSAQTDSPALEEVVTDDDVTDAPSAVKEEISELGSEADSAIAAEADAIAEVENPVPVPPPASMPETSDISPAEIETTMETPAEDGTDDPEALPSESSDVETVAVEEDPNWPPPAQDP